MLDIPKLMIRINSQGLQLLLLLLFLSLSLQKFFSGHVKHRRNYIQEKMAICEIFISFQSSIYSRPSTKGGYHNKHKCYYQSYIHATCSCSVIRRFSYSTHIFPRQNKYVRLCNAVYGVFFK